MLLLVVVVVIVVVVVGGGGKGWVCGDGGGSETAEAGGFDAGDDMECRQENDRVRGATIPHPPKRR